MRSDWSDSEWVQVGLPLLAWLLVLLLLGCTATWVPGSRTPLRPCVGVYTSPDSAGVCQPAKEKP